MSAANFDRKRHFGVWLNLRLLEIRFVRLTEIREKQIEADHLENKHKTKKIIQILKKQTLESEKNLFLTIFLRHLIVFA
jgi:hypothetical protein